MATASIVVLHVTFVITFLILASLSRIFGAAKKKKPVYRLLYVSSALAGCALFLNLLWPNSETATVGAIVLDVAGLMLGSWVAYFYWEWLRPELKRG